MPYGYLATILIWGAVTAAMLRPPHRPVPLARAVYLLSVAANELPILALLVFSLATVQAVAIDGLLETAFGPAALAAAALVAAGMLVLQRRVTRARSVIERSVGVPEGTRPFRWAWLLPLSPRPRTVERIADISYAPGGREHRLDLYRRRDLVGPAPVLIYLHGGGYFSGGKKREGRPLMHRMAERGWIVLSANYGLRPHVEWPEHLIDAKRVIAWARAHAAEHGMDAGTIVMSGSSAGAHLSVLSALTPDDPELQPGFAEADTRITAAVGLYGYYGRYYGRAPGDRPLSHPLDHPAAAAPPILLVHGDRDNYAPVQGARDLVDHLRAGSPSTVAYAELPGAQHGFDVFASPRMRAVLDGVEHFLDREVPAADPLTGCRR